MKKYISKIIFAAATVKFAPLQVVFIFFDTATYDEIERDVKVTTCCCNINETSTSDTDISKGDP